MRPTSLTAAAALLRTLRAWHQPTWAHAHRVCATSLGIGAALSLTAGELFELRWAALLHDVGKLAVPAEILDSGARLSPEEHAFVRTHPRVGYELLRRVGGLEQTAEVVHATHERMDGRGYPRGLRGIEIPGAARIVAVADAADTLMTGRPYRAAVGFPEAGAEIAKSAGEQFDPDVVRAWFALAEQSEAAAMSCRVGD